MTTRKPVICIMLDAFEPAWLERWIAAGHLPTLGHLRAESARCPVQGIQPFTGELAHVAFLRVPGVGNKPVAAPVSGKQSHSAQRMVSYLLAHRE